MKEGGLAGNDKYSEMKDITVWHLTITYMNITNMSLCLFEMEEMNQNTPKTTVTLLWDQQDAVVRKKASLFFKTSASHLSLNARVWWISLYKRETGRLLHQLVVPVDSCSKRGGKETASVWEFVSECSRLLKALQLADLNLQQPVSWSPKSHRRRRLYTARRQHSRTSMTRALGRGAVDSYTQWFDFGRKINDKCKMERNKTQHVNQSLCLRTTG